MPEAVRVYIGSGSGLAAMPANFGPDAKDPMPITPTGEPAPLGATGGGYTGDVIKLGRRFERKFIIK